MNIYEQFGFNTNAVTEDTGMMYPITNLNDFRKGDGYDWMEQLAAYGYTPIHVWGVDGWELGEWPLVIYAVKKYIDHHGNPYWSVATYTEGDVRTQAYETHAGMLEGISEKAHEWWKHNGTGPADLPKAFEDMPQKYKQPYEG